MSQLRLIGDIHGKFNTYLQIIKGAEHSIQIGDMGYTYEPLKGLGLNHRFFAGNHDNHDILDKAIIAPHWLGKYGELNGDMFFVGGGFSIDKRVRQQMHAQGAWPKTYFENEELTYKEFQRAIDLYTLLRPKIMLSHEAPRSIVNRFTDGRILKEFGYDPATFTTLTSEALQIMFEVHQPEAWYFGHYHVPWSGEIGGTKFTCIDEHDFVDIEVEL